MLAAEKSFTLTSISYPKTMKWLPTYYKGIDEYENLYRQISDDYIVKFTVGCIFGFDTYEYNVLVPVMIGCEQAINLARRLLKPNFMNIFDIYIRRIYDNSHHGSIIHVSGPLQYWIWTVEYGSNECGERMLAFIRSGGDVTTISKSIYINPKIVRLMIYKDLRSSENIYPLLLKRSLTYEKLITHPNIPRHKNGDINYVKLLAKNPKLVIVIPPHIIGEDITLSVLIVKKHQELLPLIPPTHSGSKFYEKFVKVGGNVSFVPDGCLSENTYEELFMNGQIKIQQIPPRIVSNNMAMHHVKNNKGNPNILPIKYRTKEMYGEYVKAVGIENAAKKIPSVFVDADLCREYIMKHKITRYTMGYIPARYITAEFMEKYIKQNGFRDLAFEFVPESARTQELYTEYIKYMCPVPKPDANYYYYTNNNNCVCSRESSLLKSIPEQFINKEICEIYLNSQYNVCLGHIPYEFRDRKICIMFASRCNELSNIPEFLADDDMLFSYRLFKGREPPDDKNIEKIQRELPLMRPVDQKIVLEVFERIGQRVIC